MTKPPAAGAVGRLSRRTYTIKSLMFLVLCAAVILGGYRFGYDQGSAAGEGIRRLEILHIETYFVGDLVGAPPQINEKAFYADYDTLINAIQQTITPTEWDIVGGEGSIQPVPRVQSLVTVQTGTAHDDIGDLLARLRSIAKEHDIDLTQPSPAPVWPVGGISQAEDGGGGAFGPLPETTEPQE